MPIAATFRIINENEVQAQLQSVIDAKVYTVFKRVAQDFVTFINSRILTNKNLDTTEAITWMRSKEGRGFLGWKSTRLESEISKLKERAKKDFMTTIGKNRLELMAVNVDRLASEMKTMVYRTDWQGGGGTYKFEEAWYEWLVDSYQGNPEYVVVYAIGMGESGLAYMHSIKRNELKYRGKGSISAIKRNIIEKKKDPMVEVFENNLDSIVSFLISSFTKYFSGAI